MYDESKSISENENRRIERINRSNEKGKRKKLFKNK